MTFSLLEMSISCAAANDDWHDEVDEQLFQLLVDRKLLLNHTDALKHTDE